MSESTKRLVRGKKAEALVITVCNVGKSKSGMVLLHLPEIGTFAFPPDVAIEVGNSMRACAEEITAPRQ